MKKAEKDKLVSSTREILSTGNNAFISNLEEIIKNPNSEYAGNIGLFSSIPNLKNEKSILDSKIEQLKKDEVELENSIKLSQSAKNKMGEDIKNLEQDYSDKTVELEKYTEEFEEKKKDLLKELEIEKEKFKGKIKQEEDKLQIKQKEVKVSIKQEEDKQHIAQTWSSLKIEAVSHQKFYYGIIFALSLVIILVAPTAVCMGSDVIEKYVANKELSYFGLFLLKIPYSLIVIGFISGAIYLMAKLISLVEKINNQLRDVSKIQMITETIDDKVAALYLESDGNIDELKKRENLKYKLIAEYLERLGMREFEEKAK